MNADDIVRQLVAREGDQLHDPGDGEGPRKYGVTIRALSMRLGREALLDDLRDIDRKTAFEIHYARCYLNPGISLLPSPLYAVMIDGALAHGPGSMVSVLQNCLVSLGFPIGRNDGKVSHMTVHAAREADAVRHDDLVRALVRGRKELYHAIARENPAQRPFLKEWLDRANLFLPADAA